MAIQTQLATDELIFFCQVFLSPHGMPDRPLLYTVFLYNGAWIAPTAF